MGSYMKKTTAPAPAEKGKGDEKMTTAMMTTALPVTASAAAPSASSVLSSNPTRSVKQFLHEVVRDDWQFPPPPPSSSTTVVGTKPKKNGKDDATQRVVVAWRYREEGLSDIENDRDASGRRRASRASIRPGSALYDYQNVNQVNSTVMDDYSGNPYKFDTPDAVGDFVRERRWKRRRLIAEECVWNDGLRNWIRQRDAWTGAVEKKPPPQQQQQHAGGETKAQQQRHQQKGTSRTWHARNESGGTMDSVPFSSGSEVSREPPARDASSSLTSADDISQNSLATAAAAAAGKEGEKKEGEVDAAEDGGGDDDLLAPYLPIYPPLFDEDHVLRSRIQPLAYPVIYSKVVIQSLTPNIPIPLTHMTKILVEGWKAEGNWPPEDTQPAVTAAAASNKFGKSARFLRWKRERVAARDARNAAIAATTTITTAAGAGAGAAGGAAAVADDGKEAGGGGGRRERVRKSISFAVKRGLGLGLDGHSTSSKSGAAAAAAEAEKVESAFGRKSRDGAEDMDVGIEFREHSGNEEDGEQETPEDEREASRVY